MYSGDGTTVCTFHQRVPQAAHAAFCASRRSPLPAYAGHRDCSPFTLPLLAALDRDTRERDVIQKERRIEYTALKERWKEELRLYEVRA